MKPALLASVCFPVVLGIGQIAAAQKGPNRTVTVLGMTLPSRPGGPVNVLLIAPLNQGPDATLAICNSLLNTMPKVPESQGGPATYSCRNGTVEEIAASSTKLPLQKVEKGVVAVLHVTEASGRQNDVDAFELLNPAGMLPDGRTMTICECLADGAGNRNVNDASGRVAYRDVHYTCEVDNNQ